MNGGAAMELCTSRSPMVIELPTIGLSLLRCVHLGGVWAKSVAIDENREKGQKVSCHNIVLASALSIISPVLCFESA